MSSAERTKDIIDRTECPVCGALPLFNCAFPNGSIKYLPHLDREITYYKQEGFTVDEEVYEMLTDGYDLENYLDNLFTKR